MLFSALVGGSLSGPMWTRNAGGKRDADPIHQLQIGGEAP
jgi:hypothetical protein